MQNEHTTSFMEASGTIDYTMTNNYMFRYILQKNQKVLKGLVASLLHMRPEEIHSVEIKNPINLSGDVTGKEFILDMNVLLNNNTLLNLEMQVADQHNWSDRSLIYLCRALDQLYRGQEYEQILPVIHIGLVDFTFCKEQPQFYAIHKLLNIQNQRIYSDKFTLSVLDLTQIELATKEDKSYEIDYWARVFKARTWEDLKMLAKKNEYLQEAAESLYMANADEIVRLQCLAREDAERRERTIERDKKILKEECDTLKKEKAALLARIAELEQQLNA